MQAKQIDVKQIKKTIVSKKKPQTTIKNILCHPDELYWPAISERECDSIISCLQKYKTHETIKKVHWNQLKNAPKAERPKHPRQQRTNIIHGISQCTRKIKNKSCKAILLDANINPQIMVRNILDMAVNVNIPVVCVPNLKRMSTNIFSFPSACLCLNEISTDMDRELFGTIIAIAAKLPKNNTVKLEECDRDKEKTFIHKDDENLEQYCPPFTYLRRNNKKTRIFIPESSNISNSIDQHKFSGQGFIKFNVAESTQKSNFKGMLLKRVKNNAARKKKVKKENCL